ncbi:MAG: MMPL family transporter [Planctomycetaceae bacterium]|jgi:predicted RND superfamily exporter protein|nr:MMPL family transporter [Planctomycetaceae bacterium]
MPVLFFAALPFIVHYALISWQNTENRVEDWISSTFKETQNLVDFMKVFGSDEILMISWDGCEIGTPQVEEFQKKLLQPVEIHGTQYQLYRTVMTGTELFQQLLDLGIPEEDVYRKLERWIISPQDNTTCVLAVISPDGAHFRKNAIGLVESTANSIRGLSFAKIHVAGPTMDSIAIDKASSQYLAVSNILSYLICILISWFCSRNIATSLLVFGLSFLNQQICLAIIYLSGTTFSSVLMLTVNLTFVLSMSIGVHLTNYYRVALSQYSPRLAPFAALKNAWTPTFLSVFTTVIGLFSFVFSQIIPIYQFGIFGSISLAISMLVMLVYLGGFFTVFPVKAWRHSPISIPDKTRKTNQKKQRAQNKQKIKQALQSQQADGKDHQSVSPAILWIVEHFLPRLATRHYGKIIVVSAMILIVCGFGLSYSRTVVGLKNMLLPTTKPIQDYKWLEATIGQLIPVEVLLKVPVEKNTNLVESLYAVETIQRQLQTQNDQCVTISLLNFLPTLPGKSEVVAKTVYNRKITENIESLIRTGYIQNKDGFYDFRVTVRVSAIQTDDYGIVTDSVKDVVTRQLEELGLQNNWSFFVAGGVPVFHRVQTQLLSDVKQSFGLAFVLIALVLCILLRSFVAGLLCFFPNFLPCVFVFGLIGWLGLPLEIGTILTISAALGIAVDNAIHFINWYRIGIRKGHIGEAAVNFAFRQCGPAMIQTAIIFSLGMIVFAYNVFIPTICFAIVISLLLTLALICDLIVLPAILLSPLGRYFCKNFHE